MVTTPFADFNVAPLADRTVRQAEGERGPEVTGAALSAWLRGNAAEIITEWSRALKGGTYAGYADVPLDELESACGQCLDAFVAILAAGDHGKMRRFVHREVRTRLKLGYREAEISQLLCSMRLAAWPVLAREVEHAPSLLLLAMELLQHCVDDALFELATFYQTTVQQQTEEHVAEMEAMNRRLEEISLRDSLTGLYNRRYLHDRLNQEFLRTARHHRPLSFLMVDVDHFKLVNDTFGLQISNEVLRGVALVLINKTRSIDILSRYEGEKFALCCRKPPAQGRWSWLSACASSPRSRRCTVPTRTVPRPCRSNAPLALESPRMTAKRCRRRST